jgi:antitoxin FitA
MSDLLIRDIPEALKRSLEQVAKRDGQSLSAKSIELLRNSLSVEQANQEKPFVSAWDVLRPMMYQGNDEEAEAFARIMDEVEADRKRDFGRAPPDLE